MLVCLISKTLLKKMYFFFCLFTSILKQQLIFLQKKEKNVQLKLCITAP